MTMTVSFFEYMSGTRFIIPCGSWDLYQYDPTPMVSFGSVFRANFHGDNTGSNPVGDANNLKHLLHYGH